MCYLNCLGRSSVRREILNVQPFGMKTYNNTSRLGKSDKIIIVQNARGPLKIPSGKLKYVANELSESLTLLFNYHLERQFSCFQESRKYSSFNKIFTEDPLTTGFSLQHQYYPNLKFLEGQGNGFAYNNIIFTLSSFSQNVRLLMWLISSVSLSAAISLLSALLFTTKRRDCFLFLRLDEGYWWSVFFSR